MGTAETAALSEGGAGGGDFLSPFSNFACADHSAGVQALHVAQGLPSQQTLQSLQRTWRSLSLATTARLHVTHCLPLGLATVASITGTYNTKCKCD